MTTSGIQMWAAALIALCVSPAAKSADTTLADGAWIVIERCGENARAQDADQRRGFDRRTELTIEAGRIAGHERNVRQRDGAVTNIAYDGKIEGAKVTITGTGTRSDINAPWTYAYDGTITADGHAELSGGIFMRLRESPDPVRLRECSLTFVGPKEPAKP